MVIMTEDRKAILFFQTLLKKSNVFEEMTEVNNYIKGNLRLVNSNRYPSMSRGAPFYFDSEYYLSGGNVVVYPDSHNTYLKLLVVYLDKCYKNYTKKTGYPGKSLLTIRDYGSYISRWSDYHDKSITDYLTHNPGVGCVFTNEDISNAYPNQSEITKRILYRISNSIGHMPSLNEFEKSELSSFAIETERDAPVVQNDSNTSQFFKECVNTLRTYLAYSGSSIGKAKLDSTKVSYDIFIESLSGDFDRESLKTNPLAISKFMQLYTKIGGNSETFKDKFNTLKLMSNPFREFCERAFKINVNSSKDVLYEKIPREKTSDILADVDMFSRILVRTSDYKIESNNNTLNSVIDTIVTEALKLFFPRMKGLYPLEIELAFLHYFALSTTNSKRRGDKRKNVISINGEEVQISINDICNRVDSILREAGAFQSGINYVRKWANKRGHIALNHFKNNRTKLYLFSDYPKLLPYMRFDYFKALDIELLTEEERLSLNTLRLITEDKSSHSNDTRADLLSWTLRY
uniref:p59 n=1 Tax=Tomato infectious chlorosis virus TaxID=52135 RepID=C0K288_9CLOS|nr:p59 [Tomato infectious chlorosis virus]